MPERKLDEVKFDKTMRCTGPADADIRTDRYLLRNPDHVIRLYIGSEGPFFVGPTVSPRRASRRA